MTEKARLGKLQRLGSGGSGEVYTIVGTSEVYKEVNARARKIGGLTWAMGSVAFWNSLSPADRAYLSAVSVWPTQVVEENGQPVGIVMPRLPADFWHTRAAYDGSVKSVDNAFKWLMKSPQDLAGRSFDISEVTDPALKIVLLAQAAEFVAWLHAHGVLFGDISYGNFAFALNPPRTMALDCDAVSTSPATRQANGRNTPAYRPPEHFPRETEINEATDVYKLGILTISCLTPGSGATQQRRPEHLVLLKGRISGRLMATLTAALDPDPGVRPSAGAFAQCLAEVAAAHNQPPAASVLDLDRNVARRGETVTLRWDFDEAGAIRVEIPGGQVLDVTHSTHPNGCSFQAVESGLLAVHATNRHGTSTFAAGPLVVFDVPALHVTVSPLNLPSASSLGSSPSAAPLNLPGADRCDVRADSLPRIDVLGIPSTGDSPWAAVSRSMGSQLDALWRQLRG
jgi:hypothetical protein